MVAETSIEWADHTWNPWYGCTPVSEGCENCYALRRMTQLKRVSGPGDIRQASKAIQRFPLSKKVKSGDRVFVCSWSDFFHPQVYSGWHREVVGVMVQRPDVVFLLLTKRPRRMSEWAKALQTEGAYTYEHIWLGVTAENQPRADDRIPHLLSIDWPGKKFVSLEPMLGPISLTQAMGVGMCRECNGEEVIVDPHHDLHPNQTGDRPEEDWCPVCTDAGQRKVYGLDWVIAGGETGPNARPMHPDWPRGLRDQCVEAGVPFFFKQWGEWCPESVACSREAAKTAIHLSPDGEIRAAAWGSRRGATTMQRVGRNKAGRVLDGRTWEQIPE